MSKDKVTDAEEARELLDASIREARGLLKDCRDTIREMKELIPNLVAETVSEEAARQISEIEHRYEAGYRRLGSCDLPALR